jgi:hypothetical protein
VLYGIIEIINKKIYQFKLVEGLTETTVADLRAQDEVAMNFLMKLSSSVNDTTTDNLFSPRIDTREHEIRKLETNNLKDNLEIGNVQIVTIKVCNK